MLWCDVLLLLWLYCTTLCVLVCYGFALWWSEMKWMCWWWRDAERSRSARSLFVRCDIQNTLEPSTNQSWWASDKDIKPANKIHSHRMCMYTLYTREQHKHSRERKEKWSLSVWKFYLGKRKKKRITNLYISIGWMLEQKVAFFFLLLLLLLLCIFFSSFCLSTFFLLFRFALWPYFVWIFHCFFLLSICWSFVSFSERHLWHFGVAGWWFPFSVFPLLLSAIRYRRPVTIWIHKRSNLALELITNDEYIASNVQKKRAREKKSTHNEKPTVASANILETKLSIYIAIA